MPDRRPGDEPSAESLGDAGPNPPHVRARAAPHAPRGCLVAALGLFGLFVCCTTPIGCNFIAWLGSDSATGAEAEGLCRNFLWSHGVDLPGTLTSPRYRRGPSDFHGDETSYYRFALPPGEVAAFEARVRNARLAPDPTPGIISGMHDAPWWWDVDRCGDHVSWSDGTDTVLLCRRTGKVYMSTFEH